MKNTVFQFDYAESYLNLFFCLPRIAQISTDYFYAWSATGRKICVHLCNLWSALVQILWWKRYDVVKMLLNGPKNSALHAGFFDIFSDIC